ncbi:MAG: alpha/beta hydrolase [Ruminococcaceae bacterium]|nr:alpha/beta hydrolase [Oscillospiraceae bacterium]
MLDIITHPVFLGIVAFLVGSGLALWIISYFVAARIVYDRTLRRTSKEQWSRDIPDDITPDGRRMYERGVAWSEENLAHKRDVHIVSEGLNLYGEYYDLGYDRTVMILSGRTESLRYGYFFAIPYAACGCNVLVMDPRAHGKSDGEFNTVGFEESKDIRAWVRFLKSEMGVHSVIFHGICIGAAGGMLALTAEDCPDGIDAIVTEGMFPNFSESMKNHLIERKKPVRGLVELIDRRMRRFTGHSMTYGPIDVIHRMHKPLLMLHSREDLYSTPEYAQKLFDKAGSAHKRLVWFERGKHSMLRITDTERYDSAIAAFLAEVYQHSQSHTLNQS